MYFWRLFALCYWSLDLVQGQRGLNNIQYSAFQNPSKIYTLQPNKWKTTCLAREMGLRMCRSLGLARMVTVLETRLPPNPRPPPPRWATIVRLSQLSSAAGSSLVCTDTSHNIVAGHWRRGVFGIGKMRSEASVAVLSQWHTKGEWHQATQDAEVYMEISIMKKNFLLKLVLVKSLSWLRSSKSVWKG